MTPIVKTDGKRLISLSKDKWTEHDMFDLSICKNGWQSTTIGIDKEMVYWLHEATKELIKNIKE